MGNVKLKTKFVGLIALILLVALAANVLWTSANKRAQMESELVEQGRALSHQMDAVWEFMVSNQSRLEKVAFTEDGIYQGLHCAIAGRSIGNLFSTQTEYTTRFVNFNPRNVNDEPDEWEAAALTVFGSDPAVKEYYGFEEFNGEPMFRYSAPMTIEENCLQCHGEPAGELDVTGMPKEGWTLGDIGGAISIAMPLDVYNANAHASIVQDVLFFVMLMAVCLVAVYWGLTYLVMRPLRHIQTNVEQMQAGNLEVHMGQTQTSREMNTLMTQFSSMAGELRDTYATLERQVADRTALLENRTCELAAANETLKRQQQQLEEANRLLQNENEYKSEFLSMVSHELRTPLTSIVAFVKILNRDCAPASDEERQTRQEIEHSSRILLTMIEDILEMSRVDAGRTDMAVELVDIGDMVGMVQGMVQPLADHNGVDFTIEVAPDVPLVSIDFDKMRHVVENLCGNAVKFTPRGGRVTLGVSWDAAADEVQIRVSDTGIGIAPVDQQRIFEKFVQVDAGASRHYNGTGLGLALAREYTEMHGGSIAVESELGCGSVFTVRFPRDCSKGDESHG
ncbi:DUF3365 domain-containing protein [Adlercreutzia sp. R21]|uniref:c-type heme family protein n=1 Tax=Adlercreutzia wanghongyangiae TaxID=3111451 RepID=UPI002DB57D93|nr:DUF3365 domain-containing protein [Adlercreutzia sp. R21]MEC4184417.1 DUF3365 domain-containing protein [Adlercreutzia sp. R21]